jgi:hypothetical protein
MGPRYRTMGRQDKCQGISDRRTRAVLPPKELIDKALSFRAKAVHGGGATGSVVRAAQLEPDAAYPLRHRSAGITRLLKKAHLR